MTKLPSSYFLHEFVLCYVKENMLNTILTATIFLTVGLSAHADDGTVTPYGDYCGYCATYGTCKNTLPLKEALDAIESYYREKGYRMGRVHHKERFIEVEIYRNNRLVDKVLFDRKTGRIRSIL